MKKGLLATLGLLLVVALTWGSFASETVPTTGPAGMPTKAAGGSEMDKDAVVLLVNSKNAKVFGVDTLIDTDNKNVVPFIEAGRTLVPSAFIAKAYGATVKWDDAKKEVTITTAKKTAIVTINSKEMLINGETVLLDVPAKIVEGRTFLPLRAIVESVLDKKVAYSKGLIYITDAETTLDEMKVTMLSGMLSGTGMPGGGTGSLAPQMGSSNLDTSAIKTKYMDVTYVTSANPSEAQKLDIYLPNEGTGPFPVIIEIHGGGFIIGSKSSSSSAAIIKGVEKGYAVVSVGYRLSSEAQFPAQINDIKAAIRFLRANATKYQLNPDKFATWGGSAGGSLSALAATSGNVASLQDDSLGNAGISDSVQACVDWFGPIYFSTMDAEFAALGQTPAMGTTSAATSAESKYLGLTVGTAEAEAAVKAASPQTYITAEDPAVYIQHGTADRNIPITQSVNLSEKLIAVLGSSKVKFDIIEGAGHGGSQFETEENLAKIFAFLDKYLK